jgi:ribonuclease Z
LNGYFEDPCLFVRMLYEKRTLLFDLGNMERLKPADIYKITDVFITHAHIDHFIGFDALLRSILRRDTPLNVYGPSNISSCIEGKLKGYTWNLITEYPAVINVFSFSGKTLQHSAFRAKNRFRKETIRRIKTDRLLLRDPMFQIKAAVLDHGIPCLAYSIEEEFHINIDKDRLIKKGLTVGPWLTDFKKTLREKPGHDQRVNINGNSFKIKQLMDIVLITKGQKISYITDIAMNQKNISAATRLARDSNILYCEAYFMDKDRKKALERFHLTTKGCGLIAKKARVQKLVPMHFSPKYSDCPESVIKEALDEFYGR